MITAPILLAATLIVSSAPYAGVTGILVPAVKEAREAAIEQEKDFEEKAASLGIAAENARSASGSAIVYGSEGSIVGFLPSGALFEEIPDEQSLSPAGADADDGKAHIKSGTVEGYIDASIISKDQKAFLSTHQTAAPAAFSYLYKDPAGEEKTGVFTESLPITADEGRYKVATPYGEMYVDKDACTVTTGDLFAISYSDTQAFRDRVLYHALSMENKVRYVWGGKPYEKEGQITYDVGMDCSGFIDYCVLQAEKDTGFEVDENNYFSTKAISTHLSDKEVFTETMQPGDIGLETGLGTYYSDCLGLSHDTEESAINFSQTIKTMTNMFLNQPDSKRHTDHVGFYLGMENDTPIFIHLNAKTGTVSINEGCFTVYKDLLKENTEAPSDDEGGD